VAQNLHEHPLEKRLAKANERIEQLEAENARLRGFGGMASVHLNHAAIRDQAQPLPRLGWQR